MTGETGRTGEPGEAGIPGEPGAPGERVGLKYAKLIACVFVEVSSFHTF